MAQYKLHHLEQSRSHRILWALEELELDYDIERYERDPEQGRAPDSLRQVHPLGKAPVVTTEGGEVWAESGAILEELVARHGEHLRPAPGSEGARRYRFFLHYAEGSLMPPLLIKLLMERVRSAPLPFFLKPIARAIPDRLDAAYTDPEIERHLAFLEAELAEREHFAGPDFTAADIQMFFPLESLAQVVDLPTRAPRLADFLTRMHQRDAYQRAVEVGGALDLGAV